jgi:cytochrome c oxidase subunit 4
MTSERAAARIYARTWLGLIALAVLSLWLSELALGGWATPLALFVATLKAGLIAAFFMHLAGGSPLYRLALFTAAAFIGILALLMAADVETRHDALPAAGEAQPRLFE